MVLKRTINYFIGFDHIYEINDPFINRYYRGGVDLEEFKDISENDIFRDKLRPMKPITIYNHMGGAIPYDVNWTTFPPIGPIISYNVLSIFKTNNITGWSTYPVRVFSKSGELVKGYHGLSIVGRCGRIDYSLSERVKRPPLVPQGQPYEEYVGMFFDPKTWDGSDLFCPKGMTCILAVERVVTALKKAKIKNLHFTKLSEYIVDVNAT